MKSFDDEVLKESAGPAHRSQADTGRSADRDTMPATPGAPLSRRNVIALQRTAGNGAVAQLLGDDEQQASVRDVVGRGGGQPLPETALRRMESSFGQDFTDVRIHSGGDAEASARAVQAKAYTVGNDIVLGEGSPSLESSEGQRSLAHELTHVVQQRSGPVEGTPAGDGLSISDPSDRFEREAEHVADSVTSGEAASHSEGSVGAGAGATSVQRQEEEDSEEESEES